MKVVNDNEAMLSDYEVYKVLSEEKLPKRRGKKDMDNVMRIHLETIEYLKGLPSYKYNDETVQDFLNKMLEFPLTKAEKLQILNLRPVKPVELYPIIEELETRLDEEQLDKLFKVIAETLPE